MIDWSVTNLPLPSALSVTNRSASVRKKAESGRYLQRRRFTTAYEEGTIQFKFLKEQFQIFKGVWVHYLNNGIDSFTIDLPVGGNTTLTNCEVKFVSDYSYQYVSVDYVTVQAKIEFKEVTAPDQLALDNLINVGDIFLQREAETVAVTFTNIDGSSTNRVRCALYAGYPSDPIAQATQFWDGDISLHTGSTPLLKYVSQTQGESEFVVHHFCTYDTVSPTPNPAASFKLFSVINGESNLKRWNPRATPNHYWASINLYNCNNYIPSEANNTFRYNIKDTFNWLRFYNNTYVKNIILDLEDFARFNYESSSIDGIDIDNLQSLENITVNPAPNGLPATYTKLRIVNNPLITTLDLGETKPLVSSTTTARTTYISGNQSLTNLTLTGNTVQSRDSLYLRDNALDTITITDGYFWVNGVGGGNLQRNNLDILALKAIVDHIKGHPDNLPYNNTVQVGQLNPVWQNGELYPPRFSNPVNISTISSTATEFTVTTSSAHNLTTNDYTRISGASVSGYNNRWTVASTPTTTTFTVSDTNNYGASTGGTVEVQTNSDTAYVEDTALANNFRFTL